MIRGDGVLLRRWQVTDAAWYVAARDEVIFRHTTEKRDLTVAEAEAAIRQVNDNPNIHAFAIVDAELDALVGNIALVVDDGEKTAEIMYWLAPAGRGRGLATKAVTLLTDWTFQKHNLEQVWLKTDTNNKASQKVAARAGFIQQNLIDHDERRVRFFQRNPQSNSF